MAVEVVSRPSAKKWAILLNRSITVSTLHLLSLKGKSVIKSKEISVQGASGTGNGCKRPG